MNEASIDKDSVSDHDNFDNNQKVTEQRLYKINLLANTELKFKISFVAKVSKLK